MNSTFGFCKSVASIKTVSHSNTNLSQAECILHVRTQKWQALVKKRISFPLTRCAFAMITSARLRSSACKKQQNFTDRPHPKVHDRNWPGRPVDRPRAYHDLSGCCPASLTPTSPARPRASDREKSERGEEMFSLTCWIRRTSIFCDSIFEKKSSTAWKATDLWPEADAPISGDSTAHVLERSIIFSDGRRDRGAQWDNRVAAKLTRWDCEIEDSERHFFEVVSLFMPLPSLSFIS